MSYATIADMAVNGDIRRRIAACVAEQGGAGDSLQTGALMRADSIQWQCCAEPGWSEAWESALAADPPILNPGADGAVISDGMILSAVQKHLTDGSK